MRRGFHRDAAHIVLLILLFVAAPLLELARGSSLTSLNNGDFWWHLRTGLEILRTHALPHTGWFSQSASQPWIASSWLYDIKVAIGITGSVCALCRCWQSRSSSRSLC